ncbi:YciI family protein [Demequina sp.]|uniref:YciI family protein n=1 Tax=Demequina sp. TaxID=2050685 RepID=UPI003D109D74
MTQYLFSVMHDYVNNPPIADPDKDAEMYARVGAFNESIWDQIVFLGGLHAPTSAFTAQVRDGQAIVTDGPHVETNEMIGGLWVIEAASDDEARELAKRATAACGVPVEVRAFQAIPEQQ